MKLITIFWVIIFSINCLSSYSQSAVTAFWAIHTDDMGIGFGLKKDHENIEIFCSQISDSLNIKVAQVPIVEEDFNKEKIVSELNNLSVTPDDALIIVFSDHCLCFEKEDKCYHMKKSEKIISAVEVREIAKSKNARFTLLIQDCCSVSFNMGEGGNKGSRNLSISKYEKLILKSVGFLKVCASEKEEYAFVDKDGSFMISCLFDAFDEVVSDEKVSIEDTSWEKILETTKSCVDDKANGSYQTQTVNWEGKISYKH